MRRILTCALAAAAVLLFAARTHADRVICYDLDSQIYMSSDIVEAEMVRVETAEGTARAFKILNVYLGDLKQGQTVSLPLNSEPRSLKPGDKAFFFLTRNPTSGKVPSFNTVDVKWVEGQIVHTVEGHIRGPHPQQQPIDTFTTTLADSIKQVVEWKKRLDGDLTLKDAPWLLDVLKARVKTHDSDLDDKIFEILEDKLARLRDPETTEAAIEIIGWVPMHLPVSIRSPEGRDYILKRIADESVPLQRRVALAGLLRESYKVYNCRWDLDSKKQWQATGLPIEGNGRFFERAAQLAVNSQKQPELCIALVKAIDYLTWGGLSEYGEKKLQSDANEAHALLKSVYDNTTDPQLRYHIEVAALHYGKEAYERLNSKCGPMLSIIRPDTHGYAVTPGTINLNCEYLLTTRDSLPTPEVIFLNRETQQKFTSSFLRSVQNAFGGQGGCGGPINLPKDLPPGTYRIYVQFSKDGKIISEGHYFEMNL